MTRKEVRAKVAEYIRTHRELSYREIANKLSCSRSTLTNIAREFGVTRQDHILSEDKLKALYSGPAMTTTFDMSDPIQKQLYEWTTDPANVCKDGK